MNVNKETIKKIAIGVGKVFVYGSVTLLTIKLNKEARNIYYDECVNCEDYVGYDCDYDYDYDYNDAIDSIIDSDMSSFYKDSALTMVKRNMSKEYYKAIASIASGDDSDYYKVNMIRKLYNSEAQAK